MKLSVPAEAGGIMHPGTQGRADVPLSLLVVSENEQAHIFVRHVLTSGGWTVLSRFSLNEAIMLLDAQQLPVVLCDCDLAEGWKSLLERWTGAERPSRLIIFSRFADVKLWAEALNWGAYDLLIYPFDAQELSRVTRLAAESWVREGRRNGAFAPSNSSERPQPERSVGTRGRTGPMYQAAGQ
jgi:DNA-binding NtrC family response regulator